MVVCLALAAACIAGEPDPKVPPIQKLTGIRPNATVFGASGRKKPLVITSLDAAAAHFAKAELAKLKATVDFAQQTLLVFAWRGSGQDRLTHSVAESYPEQVLFRYRPGRTRDLRPHVHLYALRSNVRWSVR
jgi:hypothetical protein